MRKIISLLLFLLALTPVRAQQDGTRFVEGMTFKQALQKAKKEKKLLFVDCYTSWCGPCHKMSAEIFPQKVCGDYFNRKFVSIKIDMEKGEGKDLMQQFAVKSFPTFLIIDGQGREVNRLVGASFDAAEFVKRVDEALDPSQSLDNLAAAFDAEPSMKNGMAYVRALMAHDQDATPALIRMYDEADESVRYSRDYMELLFTTIDYRSPFFDRLMLDHDRLIRHLGKEVLNRMVFDMYRRDMYLVADERPHEYSVADVRKAALLTSMLDMPMDDGIYHLPRVALYVIEKDLDGMADYFDRRLRDIPANDTYIGILNGLLMKQYPKATPAQREKIRRYFENAVRGSESIAKQYRSNLERFNEIDNKQP